MGKIYQEDDNGVFVELAELVDAPIDEEMLGEFLEPWAFNVSFTDDEDLLAEMVNAAEISKVRFSPPNSLKYHSWAESCVGRQPPRRDAEPIVLDVSDMVMEGHTVTMNVKP